MSLDSVKEYFRIGGQFLAEGDAEGLLRYSGEELARVSDALRTAGSPDSRQELAIDLLSLTALHSRALAIAQMYADAIATDMMALILLINLKINPEEIADGYLGLIMETLDTTITATEVVSPEVRSNYFFAASLLITLSRVSIEHYLKADIIADKMWPPVLADLREQETQIPEQLKKHVGDMRPQDALEVFTTVVQLMHDSGANIDAE
ncbi:MAG: hypothetical protein K2M55_07540 [Muribaculaceae bacterium]|nr:hypothetical protein [Muribaculaceae bacterium]